MSQGDGRSTRWDAHRAQRRETIVDAALSLLGETGPDFGLDQVAARAGVTKPVIYRFFGDRAALVYAMGEREGGGRGASGGASNLVATTAPSALAMQPRGPAYARKSI